MLSNLPLESRKVLLTIFNNIWLHKEPIPSDWSKYIIIPILKPGKSPELPDSYRPIALASCVLKTYERLIKNRLEHYLEYNQLLPPTQFGFRRGKSTQENVAHLITDIQIAFSKNNSVSAAFIDIKGAYDNVNLNILTEKMSTLGIPKFFIENIYNLYYNRSIYVRINEHLLEPRQTSLGLPQGGILSPLLYIVYVQDLQHLMNNNVRILEFADDLCLYSEERTIEKCNTRLHQAMKKLDRWSNNMGFTISETKSTVITFTRKRYQPPSHIKLHNYQLPYRTSTKFLGIVLDQKLNWKGHINHIIKKSENAINLLKTFCRHKWGADPNVALIFYKTLVRSILDYGCIFYGSAADTHLKKIERIKNKCIRISIGYLPSTPCTVLEAETGEPPLNLRREYICNKFILKLESKNSDLLRKIWQLNILCQTNKYWNVKKLPLLVDGFMKMSQYADEIQKSDRLPNFSIPYKTFQEPITTHILQDYKNIPGIQKQYIFQEDITKKWKDFEHIYTDGSKLKDKVGCAIYYPKVKQILKYKLPTNLSVFSAELVAIREAFQLALNSSKNKYVIFTDCKSAIEKIKNASPTAYSNYLISEILLINLEAKRQSKTIQLAWIRGHSGLINNEIVDKLAKEATDQGLIMVNIRTPRNDLFFTVKKAMKETWQREYEKSETGKFYKNIQPQIPSTPWFKSITDRHFIQTICRIRSNHALTPAYKHKIGLRDNAWCLCEETADLQHITLECILEEISINNLYKKLIEVKIQLPLNISTLLSLENRRAYFLLYEFIKENFKEI